MKIHKLKIKMSEFGSPTVKQTLLYSSSYEAFQLIVLFSVPLMEPYVGDLSVKHPSALQNCLRSLSYLGHYELQSRA